MKGMSKFQIILMLVFGFFVLLGVLVFASGWGSGSKTVSRVTVWGTMNSSLFEKFMREAGIDQDKTLSITYVEKNKDTFDTDFIEALASGIGPDLFFLSQDSIVKHQDKIFPIPYKNYSERDFKDTFVEEGELYMTNTGILALPFIVDPMVMYWNRDLFSNVGIATPPKYWSELYDLSTKLTKKDTNLNITKTTLALGEYGNVTHADKILSLFIMQAGNPITMRNSNGTIENLFNQRLSLAAIPAERALNFYTEFSNPLKPFYSWNRSLPDSKSYFLSGDLALYFGFASELSDIRLKNPNLNFDVSQIPQTKDSGRVITFGNMIGLAIPKNSPNIAAAYRVATILTDAQSIAALTRVTSLPPVRRDLLATKPSQQYLSLFYDGSIQSRAWLSPEPKVLGPILKEMVESVTAGRSTIIQAISRVSDQLDRIFK